MSVELVEGGGLAPAISSPSPPQGLVAAAAARLQAQAQSSPVQLSRKGQTPAVGSPLGLTRSRSLEDAKGNLPSIVERYKQALAVPHQKALPTSTQTSELPRPGIVEQLRRSRDLGTFQMSLCPNTGSDTGTVDGMCSPISPDASPPRLGRCSPGAVSNTRKSFEMPSEAVNSWRTQRADSLKTVVISSPVSKQKSDYGGKLYGCIRGNIGGGCSTGGVVAFTAGREVKPWIGLVNRNDASGTEDQCMPVTSDDPFEVPSNDTSDRIPQVLSNDTSDGLSPRKYEDPTLRPRSSEDSEFLWVDHTDEEMLCRMNYLLEDFDLLTRECNELISAINKERRVRSPHDRFLPAQAHVDSRGAMDEKRMPVEFIYDVAQRLIDRFGCRNHCILERIGTVYHQVTAGQEDSDSISAEEFRSFIAAVLTQLHTDLKVRVAHQEMDDVSDDPQDESKETGDGRRGMPTKSRGGRECGTALFTSIFGQMVHQVDGWLMRVQENSRPKKGHSEDDGWHSEDDAWLR